MSGRTKYETIRRLRLGDLRLVLRHRCGHELPNDDAGREYLTEMLHLTLDKHLANVIEVSAPWMDSIEAQELIDQIKRLPNTVRLSSPEALGQRLRLTFGERERLGVRQIAPCDLTRGQLMEQRKAKHRVQELERRQRRGAVSRDQYRQNAKALRAEAAALGITPDALRQRKLRRAKSVTSPCQKQKQSVASPCAINFNYQARTCDNAAVPSGANGLDGPDKPTGGTQQCSAQTGEVCEHEPATAWSELDWANMSADQVTATMAAMERDYWARAPEREARRAKEAAAAEAWAIDVVLTHIRHCEEAYGHLTLEKSNRRTREADARL